MVTEFLVSVSCVAIVECFREGFVSSMLSLWSQVLPGSRIHLLSVSILISIFSGNLELNFVDVSGSKDVCDGVRRLLVLLLLLKKKKLLLSQFLLSLLLQKKLPPFFLLPLLLQKKLSPLFLLSLLLQKKLSPLFLLSLLLLKKLLLSEFLLDSKLLLFSS